jgi:hypothetical protein
LCHKINGGWFLDLGLNTELEARHDGEDILVWRLEALRWSARGLIVELASKGSKAVVEVCPSNGVIYLYLIAPGGYVSFFLVVGVELTTI